MIKIEHNVETGEVKEVELTPEEVAEFEVRAAEAEQARLERLAAEEQARLDAEAKAAAKAAVLAKLGLTEEEINAFLA